MHNNYNKCIKKRERKIPKTKEKNEMLKTYEYTHIANEVIDKITGTLPEYQSKVRDLSCAERVRLISKFIKLRSDLRKVAEENGIESLNKILL